jgi:hypothetical protein
VEIGGGNGALRKRGRKAWPRRRECGGEIKEECREKREGSRTMTMIIIFR